MRKILFFVFYLLGLVSWSQVIGKIDRGEVKIGEQVKYKIEVECKRGNLVSFPKVSSFGSLEVVRSSAIDTFRKKENLRLAITYYLTQFDSGHYWIPRQKVMIDKMEYYTDSLLVSVRDVAVDTIKQPLYPIKENIKIERPSICGSVCIVGTLVGLGLLLLGLWYFFVKKKILTEEQKLALLPPFERSIKELENLEKSKLLLESNHKEYYSQLTKIVKTYLEDEVQITAVESTTDELITKLKLLREGEKLKLSDDVIMDFKVVLEKADLVKFAKKCPEMSEAEDDAKKIENVVVKTKEGLPEVSEEQKMNDREYREAFEKSQRKKRNKAMAIAIGSLLAFVSLLVGSYLFYYENYIKGTANQYLNNSEWISSTYGYPPVKITAPFVLQRELTDPKKMMSTFEFDSDFSHGDLDRGFKMDVAFKKIDLTSEQKQPNGANDGLQAMKIAEDYIKQEFNTHNVILQYDPYTTANGKQGIKIWGSFDRNGKKGKSRDRYQEYIFASEQGLFMVVFYYDVKNREKNEELIEKIMHFL